MGVAGAALSLGASEGIGTVVLAVLAAKRGLWSPGITGLSWGATKAVYRIGGPTILERLFVNGMQGVYTRILTGFGTAAFAAHRIGIDMEAFAFLPALGFGQAATTAVGRAGIIDIEREAELSGEIHTKASMILAGYLRSRFAQQHPLDVQRAG